MFSLPLLSFLFWDMHIGNQLYAKFASYKMLTVNIYLSYYAFAMLNCF